MKWIVIFLSIISQTLLSQNIVKNGGFELTDFWKCVTGIPNPNNASDIYGKPSFTYGTIYPNSGGSGRLYSTLASNTNGDSCYIKCGAPHTTFGYKMPHSGNNFSFHPQSIGYFKLSQPLIKNQQYVFECYLSSANYYHTVKPFYYNIYNDSTKGVLTSISLSQMKIGDVFIKGGSPGHALIIVDMAINPKTNKKLFMIAQSYMPAQDIHILINKNNTTISPWYELDEKATEIETAEWTFEGNQLKRF